MNIARTVKNRLTLMNIVIAFTSVIGVLSILELSKGVHLHELNLAHYEYGTKLERQLESSVLVTKADLDSIRKTIKLIREQPVGCLKHHDMVIELGTKLLGTYRAFKICEDDIVTADRALHIIDEMELSLIHI